MSICDLWCEGCDYLASWEIECDYLLITGHPRGCPAGTGCTERKRPEKWRPDKRLQGRERAMLARAAMEEKARKERAAALAAPKRRGRPRKNTEEKTTSQLNREWLLRKASTPERKAQGAAVRAWRTGRGLSQADAGRLLGVEGVTVGRWERGEAGADWIRLAAAGCARPEGV